MVLVKNNKYTLHMNSRHIYWFTCTYRNIYFLKTKKSKLTGQQFSTIWLPVVYLLVYTMSTSQYHSKKSINKHLNKYCFSVKPLVSEEWNQFPRFKGVFLPVSQCLSDFSFKHLMISGTRALDNNFLAASGISEPLVQLSRESWRKIQSKSNSFAFMLLCVSWPRVFEGLWITLLFQKLVEGCWV